MKPLFRFLAVVLVVCGTLLSLPRSSAQTNNGSGIPDGGTTGQVLGKLSGADQNYAWIDQTGEGGSADGYLTVAVGTPSGGSDGDSWLNLSTGDFYFKSSGSWGSALYRAQPYHASLASIAGLTTLADRGIYATASNTYAVYTLTAGGRALGGVAGTANTYPYFSSSNTVTLGALTASGISALAYAATSADMVYWNGSAWTAIGSTTAGGRAFLAVSPSADYVYYWNGSAWTPITTTAAGRAGMAATATTAAGFGFTNGSTIDAWGAIAPAAKADLGANTFSGIQRYQASTVTDATPMGGGTSIDVTKPLNTKSLTGNVTLTFSGTPATSNTWFSLRVSADSTARVVTIPSSYDINSQATVTSFTVQASGTEMITWCYDGSTYVAYGIPSPGYAAEATVASATTTDIGAATSINVSISGTTTITGLGTVASGTYRQGRFTGALTFTHNGTSLILPNGGSNITTAANDRFGAVSLGSGNWLVLWYQKANGQALSGSSGLGDPSGNGIVVRTSSGTTTARTLTDASATYTTTTDGSGVSGNPTIALTDRVKRGVDNIVIPLTIDALADSMNYGFGYLQQTFTITDIWMVHVGSGLSSPSINANIKYGTTRTSGTQVVTGGTTVTSSSTGSHVTSFNNASASGFLWVETSSKSGTTDKFEIYVIGHY